MSLRKIITQERAIALPMALFLVMVISAVTAILSATAQKNLEVVKSDQISNETFYVAEGVVADQIRRMSVQAQLWSDQVTISTIPSGYTQYSPSSYSSQNGIPTCTGAACQRNLYPVGGGIVKNVGPLTAEGASVDSNYTITEQLDPNNLPTADITLANRNAWVQVERLDQTTPSASTVGGSLSNGVAEGGNASAVRFRITGMTLGSIKGRVGQSTVVAVIEMPIS